MLDDSPLSCSVRTSVAPTIRREHTRTTVLYTTIGTSRADDKVQLLAFLQRLNAENNSLGEVDNDTRCPSCRLVIIGCLNISIEDTKTCVFRTHRTCNHLLRPTCSHQSSY
ncbi:hypothetical protein KCU68_g196, partial [Aureobasidium melanogenum]